MYPLSQLQHIHDMLVEDIEKLPYQEGTYEEREWRYARLLWQDKLQLELVHQLTRIGNLLEARNLMTRDMLLGDDSLVDHLKEEEL